MRPAVTIRAMNVVFFRCNPNTTQFPTVCTANNTQIPGELVLQEWHLDFAPFYVNYLVMAGIVVITRCAAYIALRFMKHHRLPALYAG